MTDQAFRMTTATREHPMEPLKREPIKVLQVWPLPKLPADKTPKAVCHFCGKTAIGVTALGGWWICDSCDREIERVPGRTVGKLIAEGLKRLGQS